MSSVHKDKRYNDRQMALMNMLYEHLGHEFAKFEEQDANLDTKTGLLHVIHDARCVIAQILDNYLRR